MNTGVFTGAGKAMLSLLCIMNLLLIICPRGARGDLLGMRGYCNTPPLAGAGVKPNLLLMIDNSASMYDPAYTEPSEYCLDDSADTYELGAQYVGYFDPGSIYSYSFPAGSAAGNFVLASAQAIPSTPCNAASNGYLCLNITSGTLDSFVASGNFLNWLTMSKLDIEKKVLTGGKVDPVTGLLQPETRGCQGKRFVKMVGGAQVTFAVRGPIPSESDYSYQSSRGGMTRIEVYPKHYNKDACVAAVTAWQQGATAANLKAAALNCLNKQYDDPPNNTIPSQGKIYTEIMSDCYSYLAPGGTLALDKVLLGDCKTRVAVIYNNVPSKIIPNTGDDVCGAGAYHNLTNEYGIAYTSGYLGTCYRTRGGFDMSDASNCILGQTIDYCKDLAHPWLTDPSSIANMTGTNLNVPGFILEAGISNLGAVAGTLLARVASAAPTGLLQEFGTSINFGAMVFNNNGAGSECGDPAGTILCVKHCQYDAAPQKECSLPTDCLNKAADACQEDPHTDGGRIISYLNHSPLGNHTPGSGLIASIDAVTANSWTPLAESFYDAIGYFANRGDLRLQPADFDLTWPPSQYSCQSNNILILTDGISTADRSKAVADYVAAGVQAWGGTGGMPASQTTASSDTATALPPFQGSYNLDDLAWIASHKNIADSGAPIVNNRDFLTTYVVYTGAPCGDPIAGTGYAADGSCTTTDEGVPEKLMQLVASKGGGGIVSAQKPADLEGAIGKVLLQLGAGPNSATDATILSTGSATGAVFLQEQFYPKKSFDAGLSSASWIGEMQALWYYIDPFLASTGGASTIREDTGGALSLDLKRDRVVQFGFNAAQNTTLAHLYLDADGDGSIDPSQPAGYPQTVSPDAVQSLWRAGLQLWKRDPATRTIYTQTNGLNLTPLSGADANQQLLLQAADPSDAGNIVSFVQGTDSPATRNRSLYADGSGARKVWKLGDIVSANPTLQSATTLGNYSLPAPQGYGDSSYALFSNSGSYQKRGTVYVGANDGMLHAFRLGALQVQRDAGWPASQKATLSGTDLGKEEWAFVPKNALPYLKYLQQPTYPHLYFVDGSSTLADVSLGDPASCSRTGYWNCPKDPAGGTNWRTVLLGGMGLGGATRSANDSCGEGASGTCVKAPQPSAGFSSYFALDVTGQAGDGSGSAPTLLWEFSPPGLGFATSGAAILKLNTRSGSDLSTHDHATNGRWFAVFASGPTGSIDSGTCQFQGKSDQNLKLFVVDLNAVAPFTLGGNYWVIDTGIPNAFGGSMAGAGIDTDRWNPAAPGNYEDNALYVGYTGQAGDGSWTTGGVLRLLTRENPDPGQWVTSKVIDGIGPVTGAVSKLQDRKNHNLWLYFGTGRYFYNQDDMTAGRALFGVKEPCYLPSDTLPGDQGALVTACSASAPLALSDLNDASAAAPASSPGSKGWWIGLDAAATPFGSERLTANPKALAGGGVSFATFKPASDLCQQGASYLWLVRYDSGGSSTLNGKAIVPLSNGSSAEILLSTLADRGGRRSQQMTGKPGGIKLITNSGLKPLKKIIHIQER